MTRHWALWVFAPLHAFTKTFEIADNTNDSELGGVGYGAAFP